MSAITVYARRWSCPRDDPLLELDVRDTAQLQRGFLQRQVLLVRLLGDLRGLVIADVRD